MKNVINWFRSAITPTVSVQQIHADFFTAGEKLLEQANALLDSKAIETSELLASSGFVKAQGVERGLTAKRMQTTATLIREYSVRYPSYKFITEEKVNELCQKYGLIYGPVGNYTGEVPHEKLLQIKAFKGVKKEDVCLVVTGSNWRLGIGNILSENGAASYEHIADFIDLDNDIKQPYRNYILRGFPTYLTTATTFSDYKGDAFAQISIKKDFVIVGPKKDFDLKGMNVSGFKVVKNIPDPVVLAPIRGGYLILAAWGDEASDPIVVNEKMN